MSASDNLSVELFRAIRKPKVTQPLGIHWSSVNEPNKGAGLFVFPDKGETHTIVHGRVNPRSIVTGTDKKFMDKHQILDQGEPEYEEPVYPGSKVAVTAETRVRNVEGKVKKRKRNYNPPREMTA
jgi:hypothetical protein